MLSKGMELPIKNTDFVLYPIQNLRLFTEIPV